MKKSGVVVPVAQAAAAAAAGTEARQEPILQLNFCMITVLMNGTGGDKRYCLAYLEKLHDCIKLYPLVVLNIALLVVFDPKSIKQLSILADSVKKIKNNNQNFNISLFPVPQSLAPGHPSIEPLTKACFDANLVDVNFAYQKEGDRYTFLIQQDLGLNIDEAILALITQQPRGSHSKFFQLYTKALDRFLFYLFSKLRFIVSDPLTPFFKRFYNMRY